LSLKLSDTRVYEPQIRDRLGTTAHFWEVVVLKLSPRTAGRLLRPVQGLQQRLGGRGVVERESGETRTVGE